jgi:feruloyl esterase
MGRDTVDAFARLFVLPQTDHGLSGSSASINGSGKPIAVTRIPTWFDRFSLITAWVEQNKAPNKTIKVFGDGGRSQLMCSFPNYPKYMGGPAESADSYVSTEP